MNYVCGDHVTAALLPASGRERPTFPWQFCKILGPFEKLFSIEISVELWVGDFSKALALPPTHPLTMTIPCCLSASWPHGEMEPFGVCLPTLLRVVHRVTGTWCGRWD